jgi:hypothetical protein
VDLAKNVFQLHGVDELGQVCLRRRVQREKVIEVPVLDGPRAREIGRPARTEQRVSSTQTDGPVARLVLYILVCDLRLAVGQRIPDQALKAGLVARNRSAEDVRAALRYAYEHGWVQYDGPGRDAFTLTEEGYKVGDRIRV